MMYSEIDFVIKGLFLYGSIIFLVIFLITAWIAQSVATAGKLWGTIFGVLFVGFTIFSLVDSIKRKNQLLREEKQFEEFIAHSKGFFDERCKSAGLFIYDKEIPPQESVYIMRPVSPPYSIEYERNRFNFSQIYYKSLYSLLLRSPNKPYGDTPSRFRFSYIESFDPTFPERGLFRLEKVYFPEKNIIEYNELETKITKITSQYGTTWEDLTTPEDLEHSLVGGRMQIIELKTNKVAAELIDYKLKNDAIYNLRPAQKWKGWNSCRSGKSPPMSSHDFILSVLRNPKLLNK